MEFMAAVMTETMVIDTERQAAGLCYRCRQRKRRTGDEGCYNLLVQSHDSSPTVWS